MDPAEYERMHALESHYWWFVGRRYLVERLLNDALPSAQDSALRLVDIGCGTGANLPMLRRVVGAQGQVYGFDFSPLALRFARHQLHDPNVSLCRSDALALPLRDNSADAVTLLDVLEHLEDDAGALAEVKRVLRPGGVLVLSVPAYQHLWSAHDEALHHFRRYEKWDLNQKLREAGLQVEKLSFAMSLMPPLAWAWRRFVLPFKQKRPRDAKRHSEGAVLPQIPDWANQMLVNYVALEGKIIARRPVRFGTSLVAVARK